jgi:hypothetical protein
LALRQSGRLGIFARAAKLGDFGAGGCDIALVALMMAG